MRFILILFICWSFGLFAQSPLNDWIGTYQGTMTIGNVERPTETLDVTFTMSPVETDSIWTYVMTFHSEEYGEMVKDYRIVAANKGTQHQFTLDEQDGILIPMTYLNDCLYSSFELLNNMYTTTLRKTTDGLLFEIIVTPLGEHHLTHAHLDPEEDKKTATPPMIIKTYKSTTHQTVYLQKQ